MTQAHAPASPPDLPVHRLIRAYAKRSSLGVQLYAGANYLSPVAEKALACGMGAMPAMGRPFAKQQPGTDEISAVEELVETQLLGLFGGTWAEARLQSCTLANAVVYTALCAPGGLIATIGLQEGGHVSHQSEGTIGMLGRRTITLPFSNGNLDDEKSASAITEHRPEVVMVGGSVMLSSYQLSATIRAAHDVGAVIAYDASHVLGLIAGGVFQNPMELGVDIMTASTYKSFGGPPGGILIGRHAAHAQAVRAQVVGAWTSNYDAARLAALSVSLAEAREFMPDYARKMLDNARVLGQALYGLGVDVVGLTSAQDVPQTHQLVIRCRSRDQALELSKLAEANGLYIGTCSVAGEPDAAGLRLGTQAVTRKGANSADMLDIGGCLARLVRNPAGVDVSQTVGEIASRLTEFKYCYTS